MIGFPIGLLYSNAAEWWIHKYLLHGLGKRKSSIWSFHLHEHHKNVKDGELHDPEYDKPFLQRNGPKLETLGVVGLMALHVPLMCVAPWLTAAVWYSGTRFIYTHERAHQDPEWTRKYRRWHYDHHMSTPNANYCVTRPWMDYLMGTHVHVGD